MGRKRGQQLPFWLTGKGYKYSANKLMAPWVRLDQSLMQDETFRSLSAQTQLTYLCLCLEAGKHNDRFNFSNVAAEKYHISYTTYRRALKELEDGGFLERSRPKRGGYDQGSKLEKYLPTEFTLIPKWKDEAQGTEDKKGKKDTAKK